MTGYLYATPHGLELSSGTHATFLIRSVDGVNWTYVSTEPIVRPTPGFWAFDHVHVGYGRFLRTYDHDLVRIDGRAIWYYRGEEHPSAGTKKYQAGAATSTDLATWNKVSTSPLFNPNNGGIFSLGSALYVNGRSYLIMNVGVGDSVTYLKQDAGDPLVFSGGAGVPIYNDPASVFFTDGPNYFLDRRTDRHYFAYANGHLDNLLTGQLHAEVHVALGT